MPGHVKVWKPGLSFFTDESGRQSDRLVEAAVLNAFATLKRKLLHRYWFCMPESGKSEVS